MSSAERRPLLSTRHTHSFIRQPLPERVGSYRKDYSGNTSHVRTFINSVNILIGAGLLSLPLAFLYTGWILGFTLLALSAGMSACAARSLTQCLDQDASLQSYVDVAGAAFGPAAQLVTSVLFSLVMVIACVALTVLFGDAMALLVPSLSTTQWKMIFGAAILPLQFANLRTLAPLSIVGVLSGVGIVVTTIVAGLVKTRGPGSLRQPAATELEPGSFLEVALSTGLFLAPWGASVCVPSFYRDMKTPKTYTRCVVESFSLCFAVSGVMGAAGYLMFGAETSKEIIHNILTISSDYPHALVALMVAFTSLMPVTKTTLTLRPFIEMLDETFTSQSIDSPSKSDVGDSEQPRSPLWIRSSVRVAVMAAIVLLSIAIPDFDRIMAIMGAALCCPISILLPSAFHLRLCKGSISWAARVVDCVLLGVGGVMTAVGVVGAVLS